MNHTHQYSLQTVSQRSAALINIQDWVSADIVIQFLFVRVATTIGCNWADILTFQQSGSAYHPIKAVNGSNFVKSHCDVIISHTLTFLSMPSKTIRWPNGGFRLRQCRRRWVNINRSTVRYANGVHLSGVLENTALVKGIRCEPLGEHLVS